MKIVDNLIAFRILYMLVTPFEKTDAFKFGIIDKDGKPLRKAKDLKTTQEQNAYTYLHRLVFSLKRLLGKLLGGKSRLATFAAALYLVKEAHDNNAVITLEKLEYIIDSIEADKITMVEEEIMIEEFLELYEDGAGGGVGGGAGATPAGPIANVAGDKVATDYPAIRLNKKNRPKTGIIGAPNYMVRRNVKPSSMGAG